MKIGLVVPHMLVGGVEIFVLRLGSFLKSRGHEVTVVACEQEGEWWPRVQEAGLNGICLPQKQFGSVVLHALEVGRLLKRERFDCLLLNHAKIAQFALNLIPDHTAVIPVIHNDVEEVYQTAFLNEAAWNVGVGVSPKVVSRAREILPRKTFVEITHGVNIPAPEKLPARSLLTKKLRCLFVGQLSHKHKGIFFLPSIIEECRCRGVDVSLDIIGDGPDRDRLVQLIEEKRMSNYIKLWGKRSNDEVYSELLSHHALLLTSYFEGLGIVLLEAASAGCVPVAHRLPGITDSVVDNGATGVLCEIGDVTAMADALARFSYDAQLWESMSRAAIARAKANFSMDKMGDSYLALIEDVVAGKYPLAKTRKTLLGFDPSLFRRTDYVPYYVSHPLRALKKQLRKKTRAPSRSA